MPVVGINTLFHDRVAHCKQLLSFSHIPGKFCFLMAMHLLKGDLAYHTEADDFTGDIFEAKRFVTAL